MENLIESKKIKISHIETQDRYILTAKTEELQKFSTKFANERTTFIEADTLIRQDLSVSIPDMSRMLDLK